MIDDDTDAFEEEAEVDRMCEWYADRAVRHARENYLMQQEMYRLDDHPQSYYRKEFLPRMKRMAWLHTGAA